MQHNPSIPGPVRTSDRFQTVVTAQGEELGMQQAYRPEPLRRRP